MPHLPLPMGNRIGNRCKRDSVYQQSAHLPSTDEPTLETRRKATSVRFPYFTKPTGCIRLETTLTVVAERNLTTDRGLVFRLACYSTSKLNSLTTLERDKRYGTT